MGFVHSYNEGMKFSHIILLAVSLLIVGCSNNSPGIVSTQAADPIKCLRNIRPEAAKVIEIVDGDTVMVEIDGMRSSVRYLGVDTPEMSAQDNLPGVAAKNLNTSLVKDQTIELYADIDDRDDFGRLLRYVVVNGLFVNYELVNSGNATTFNRPPNEQCADELKSAMLHAYENRLGIWQKSDQDYSYTGEYDCPDGCLKSNSECLIKGNINTAGDMVYHLPGEEDYREVRINPEKGERWFCTIAEAIKNGWRPQRVE